jgi:hypothetical protein
LKNKKTPGQAIVIITIFIAVIILLSIVLINIGKVSDIKTTTAQIADSGVLGLASQWSMYCDSLRQTLHRKADSTSLLAPIIGWAIDCTCTDTTCRCINWGLILPLFGVLLVIILMPFSPMISAGIFLLVANPLFTEVSAIMKSGWQTAAAEMTQYAAMRESSISSMLGQAQFDKASAEWWTGDIFRYIYEWRVDPATGQTVPYRWYTYDFTGLPFAATIKAKEVPGGTMPRYVAWYWSKRHPKVSEAKLVPLVENYITNGLLKPIEINSWDAQKWLYTVLSLKVDAPRITCNSSTPCPEWADPDKDIVRILSHVTVREENVLKNFTDWLLKTLGFCYTDQKGFLPEKFTELTRRLRLTTTYNSYVTWTDCEIVEVTEALRGMVLRIMELMNVPVSYRIPTLNDWLPVWYNYNNIHDPATIYGRLYEIIHGNGQIVGLEEWLQQLYYIAADVDQIIPLDDKAVNGDCRDGVGSPVGWCWAILCCEPCEYYCCCGCSCCGAKNDCTWVGTYCSCNPELYSLGLCGHGDVYSTKFPPCPLPTKNPYCPCGGCTGGSRPTVHSIEACRFQGQLTWAHGSPPSEIDQAYELLSHLLTELSDIMVATENFANAAHAIMYPDAATQQLQKEAIYGWTQNIGNNQESLNMARVNLDNYPPRDYLPFIKEGYDWLGLFKLWEITPHTSGPIGEVTVQRYTSDIGVGQWWNLRYRMQPGTPEWNTTTLSGYIHSIQDTGTSGASESEFNTHAITSATKGTYGMNKQDISIQRVK